MKFKLKKNLTCVCKSKAVSSTVVLLSLNRSNGDGVESWLAWKNNMYLIDII
jgi:hypothetical protein